MKVHIRGIILILDRPRYVDVGRGQVVQVIIDEEFDDCDGQTHVCREDPCNRKTYVSPQHFLGPESQKRPESDSVDLPSYRMARVFAKIPPALIATIMYIRLQ